MLPKWFSQLNRYQWFVLMVAALGWLFDTMDQQLFNLARKPAITSLLQVDSSTIVQSTDVDYYGGIATSIFLIGWAIGGLFFGILGDRIGRAKTMMLTILLYSACTGLSAFSQSVWDFSLYRFLTGLGVGGEFAVGVALVAETMPTAVRARALGLLQALSAVGNVGAALITMVLGNMEASGSLGVIPFFNLQLTMWRCAFLIGALPALLALVIRSRLREPESWSEAKKTDTRPMGSYKELFGNPRWRKNAILGMLLALTGVVGVWGIAFFSVDLQRSVFRKSFETNLREDGKTNLDRDLLRFVLANPSEGPELLEKLAVPDFVNTDPKLKDATPIASAMFEINQENKAREEKQEAIQPINLETVFAKFDKDKTTEAERNWRKEYLEGEPKESDAATLATNIKARSSKINGDLTFWISIAFMLQNLGAFFGIYIFGTLSERIGRKPTFAICNIIAALSIILVFSQLQQINDIYWMMPIMGFCTLSLFGGYAIYLPELFPTRLRSTGTSFCYNVGRLIAAAGPAALGYLTSTVFAGYPEPMRPAGIVMCSIYFLGLLVLPFAPETKGQPLPE